MLAQVVLTTILCAANATPMSVVKKGNDEVQQIISGPDPSVEKLATKVDNFVDFGELAKRALGKEWDKLNKHQRNEFSVTMRGLLRASYAQKAMGQGNVQVDYVKETVNGNEAEVDTTVEVKKDKVPVDYRLYRSSAKSPWRIYDVVTDEVSLVDTYRGQFRKLIAEKGYDGLLSTLKAKREQLERSGGAAGPASN